jgi:hypothetical protein
VASIERVSASSTSSPLSRTLMRVGHLRHDGKIMGDVDRRRVELPYDVADRGQTSIWVVTSSAVVGSSKMIRSGRQDIAMAVIARCSCPPETWCGYRNRSHPGWAGAATVELYRVFLRSAASCAA